MSPSGGITDTRDLKSLNKYRAGSSPASGTKQVINFIGWMASGYAGRKAVYAGSIPAGLHIFMEKA